MKVFCLGDPVPEGVLVLSHCDMESEHYRAIRFNPQYRIEWNRLEWEARQEPPITQERVPEAPSDTPCPVKVPQHISYQLDQLKWHLLHIEQTINNHVDASKKRAKKKQSNIPDIQEFQDIPEIKDIPANPENKES